MARANRSPRAALSRSIPALAQGQGAVLAEDDAGLQIQDTTLVANSAAAVNIILNSLLTSNVMTWAVPIKGYSGSITYSEVTDPNRSAVFLSVTITGISAAVANTNVPSRVFMWQRAE